MNRSIYNLSGDDRDGNGLVAHDPAWRSHFDGESIRVSHTLVVTAARIAHIGSTAVPDLPAMPVIDLMVGVERYPPTPAFVEPLQDLGYAALGERGLAGRLQFSKRGAVAFDLHLVQFAGPVWQSCLLVRDYLTANGDAAADYARAKRMLTAPDRDAMGYLQQKAALLVRLADEAQRWKSAGARYRAG